ncbi:MAG: deoxyribonuclease IV [Candidatus Riflebacteria bacterium]|nr:deoxyribonuclease IV [Candidatus Riflebacteria bacterium]
MSPRKVRPELLIGAHVGGGLTGAVARALQIGAGPVQIFIGSPQTWREPSPKDDDFASFSAGLKQHALGPAFVHASYLVNLATCDPTNRDRSVNSLRSQLRLADRAGAAGLIFHPGSAGQASEEQALTNVIRAVEAVLDGYTGCCRLVLEVCAGQGQTIGDRFPELAAVLDALGRDRRLGVCWDTCHLFAAGYDVATADGLARTVDEFETTIGFEWLCAIHANDSKTPLASRKDRHENIGKGHIGAEAFSRMLHHPRLRPLPWILEVPGFDGNGPDRLNVEILKGLARVQSSSRRRGRGR